MTKIYNLCYPEVRTVTAAQIEAGYSDAIANGDIVGNSATLIYLTTDEKAAALHHAGQITLVQNPYIYDPKTHKYTKYITRSVTDN